MNPLTFARSLARLLAGRPQMPPDLAGNALLRAIYHRRSIRSFTAEPVRDDEFAAILEAGRLAPSTVNLQSWSFAVFTADTWRETFDRPIPFRAQRAVIVLGDMHRMRALLPDFPDCPLVDYTTAVMNASLAAMNMNLAAEALGISSVMLSETGRSGILDAEYLKEVLGLPEQVFPLTTIVFGRARGVHPPMPPKLPMSVISFQGRYSEPDPALLRDWLDQMTAGYKAMRPTSSLEDQLQVYESKVEQAEADLRRMVFGPLEE